MINESGNSFSKNKGSSADKVSSDKIRQSTGWREEERETKRKKNRVASPRISFFPSFIGIKGLTGAPGLPTIN